MPAVTSGPRKPDYDISVMNKDTQKKLPNAGGGWKNADGSITLSLNPCVVLSGNDNIALALFPANQNYPPNPSPSQKAPQSSFKFSSPSPSDEDEIPF